MASGPPILAFQEISENGQMSRTKIVKKGGYQPTSDPGSFPASLIRDDATEVPSGAVPLGTQDQRLVKGLAHELRVEMLAVLDEREASPRELAKLLDESLSQVSYHTKVLMDYGIIELTRSEPRRGAIEHFYRIKEEKQRSGLLKLLTAQHNPVPDEPVA